MALKITRKRGQRVHLWFGDVRMAVEVGATEEGRTSLVFYGPKEVEVWREEIDPHNGPRPDPRPQYPDEPPPSYGRY